MLQPHFLFRFRMAIPTDAVFNLEGRFLPGNTRLKAFCVSVCRANSYNRNLQCTTVTPRPSVTICIGYVEDISIPTFPFRELQI